MFIRPTIARATKTHQCQGYQNPPMPGLPKPTNARATKIHQCQGYQNPPMPGLPKSTNARATKIHQCQGYQNPPMPGLPKSTNARATKIHQCQGYHNSPVPSRKNLAKCDSDGPAPSQVNGCPNRNQANYLPVPPPDLSSYNTQNSTAQ